MSKTKYEIPKFLRRAGYMKLFYARIRRMKRHGYTYDAKESVMSNLFMYVAYLNREGKVGLANKEMEHIGKILDSCQKIWMREERWRKTNCRRNDFKRKG